MRKKKFLSVAIVILLVIFLSIIFAAYQQAITLQRDPSVLMNKSYWLKEKNPNASKVALEIILHQNKDYIPALQELSQIYLKEDKVEKALPLLEHIEELSSSDHLLVKMKIDNNKTQTLVLVRQDKMPGLIMLMLYFLMWYFLVILSIFFIISGLDDLFIDLYYWVRYFIRLWSTRLYSPLTYQQLTLKNEQLIAIMVPCWHEDNVIPTMLKHNCYSIDYNNYYFFVGVYPNDQPTVDAVKRVAEIIPNVQCVIGEKPGPTNKAANLNSIYNYIKTFEKQIDKQFDIFVFHDSEDVIHPLSFKLYNYLIPRKDMIQIPIFPIAVSYWNFTHWTYADEFAENHTKDIIVREALKAHVPSAGVGTAFSRKALYLLEDPVTEMPFSVDSLTEDYRTSLSIRLKGLKQVFVVQRITHLKWEKKGIFRDRYEQKKVTEFIATRALFPVEYIKAVRQKSRWIIGIVFQEWSHINWPKEWAVRYTLAHDRKTIFTHFIDGFGYFVFAFWIFYYLMTSGNPYYPSLQEQFNMHSWVWWLIITITVIMCDRLVQRAIAIRRVYHKWIPAFLAIPRAFYGNIINLHAVFRAYRIYRKPANKKSSEAKPGAKQVAWDKTDHHFPGSHILVPYRRKLGDLLVEQGLISKEQLNRAIWESRKTNKLLGQVLIHLGLISEKELSHLLSAQYQLSLFPQNQLANATNNIAKLLPKKLFKWLTQQGITPVSFDEKNKILTLAIEDPTNEPLIEKIINNIAPYTARFVLIEKES